jgi:hypothetical protein
MASFKQRDVDPLKSTAAEFEDVLKHAPEENSQSPTLHEEPPRKDLMLLTRYSPGWSDERLTRMPFPQWSLLF